MIWKRCIPLLENWSRCLRRGNCGKAKRPGVDKAQNQVHTNTNWHTGCSCSFSIHCAKKIFSLWPFFVHRGKGYTRCCELGLLGDAVTSLQQARCVSDRDTVSDSAQNWSSCPRASFVVDEAHTISHHLTLQPAALSSRSVFHTSHPAAVQQQQIRAPLQLQNRGNKAAVPLWSCFMDLFLGLLHGLESVKLGAVFVTH